MIAEQALLDVLEGVHSGRLRVHEAYRALRAAESTDTNVDREGIAQVFHNVLLIGGGTVARVEIDEAIDQVVAFVRPAQRQTVNRVRLRNYLWGLMGDEPAPAVVDDVISYLHLEVQS